LYVAEIGRIWKLPAIEQHLDAPPKPVTVRDDLPDKSHHGWRFIDFGPDGKLYVALGAPCNVCDLETFVRDGRTLQFGSITRMDADGRNWEVVARGVRNSVGFAWEPRTSRLWFTENGRDMLGDDVPSCELNVLDRPGEDYGFPYCHADTIADPQFGKNGSCATAKAPAALLGAHVAPLGMTFYSGTQFPQDYVGDAFVAEHGSWNRSNKIGYRVMRIRMKDGKVVGQEPFVDGWLKGQEVSGRPADVLQMPDGALLVSDDQGDRIWRVSYRR
jgi:glucose/arabinose dehydrogenase